ncbi:MAG: nucleotidyltransferase domain-containing protein [Sulfolobales archaeon]
MGGSESFLATAYEFLSKLPGKIGLGDICSVVVFGSAARPSDFVPGVSDIDVLVLVEKAPEKRFHFLEFMGTRVNIVVFTPEDLNLLIEKGDPLGFMLRYSIVLLDRGCLALIKSRPRITQYTIRTLRKSIFAALGLAVESYYLETPKESVSYLYHSVRHLARYLYSLKGDEEGFPVSDEELLSRSPEDLRELLKKLIEMRRRETRTEELRKAIEESIELIARKLGLEKTGIEVLDSLADKLLAVVACEEDTWLVFRVELMSTTGLKRLRLRGSEATEVEDILCNQN